MFNNKSKNHKVGVAMGGSVLSQNPLVPKSAVLKDAVSIRSFKEKPGISNSYEKKMLLENFKQYKPFGLRYFLSKKTRWLTRKLIFSSIPLLAISMKQSMTNFLVNRVYFHSKFQTEFDLNC